MAEKETYSIPNQEPSSGPTPIPTPPPRPARPRYTSEPERKKFPLWGKVLIGGAVFLVAIITVVFVGTSDAVKVVEDQIALVQEGNLEAAYGLVSEEFRVETPFEEFVQLSDYADNFRSVEDVSFTNREILKNGDGTFASLEGTFNLNNGEEVAVYYDLKKEGDDWKIVYIEFN